MAGIYIHIPYCRKACHYCNFHFSTSLKSLGDMVTAIEKELYIKRNYLEEDINTIYFGGGTPSILQKSETKRLINAIYSIYSVKSDAEITFEVNPEDITEAKAKELFQLGINRISLGVQSFDDNILKKLNRAHSKEDAINAVYLLQKNGLNNITLDLIYGIHGQNLNMWKENLTQANKLNIPHLSCYALTIEEKTAFGHWLKTGKLKTVSDIEYEEEYKVMCTFLKANGYEHYEVSNFSKPGFESKHNSSYWRQQYYIGVGPGAHSYNGKSRQFNVSNNATYIKALKNGVIPSETEILSREQLYNEYILTGLRTNQGINFTYIKLEFGFDILKKNEKFINRCLKDNLATLDNDQFVLTDNALILADSIIIELMIDK